MTTTDQLETEQLDPVSDQASWSRWESKMEFLREIHVDLDAKREALKAVHGREDE